MLEHVEGRVNDLVLLEELLVDHDQRDIIGILQGIVHVQVINELRTGLSDQILNKNLLLLGFSEVSGDRLEGGLVQIALEAVADAHDGSAKVGSVVKDDHVSVHGVEIERLVIQNIADIKIQIEGLDESLAARSSEDEFLKSLNIGLLDCAANDTESGLRGEKAFLILLLLGIMVAQKSILGVVSKGVLVNLEELGDLLQEVDAGEDLAEVHATLEEQVVLGLQEFVLLVDVLINLLEQLAGSHV